MAAAALVPALIAALATGCSTAQTATMPRCGSVERVALVAQSVPSSSYVVCIARLPAGWNSENTVIRNGHTSFHLVSDRAAGDPVVVDARSSCRLGRATPVPPRTAGGRTYLSLRSIDPRYAGTMYDVFPGGCVTYRFDFARGPHIALLADLRDAVGFVSRQDLRRQLHDRLGVGLQP